MNLTWWEKFLLTLVLKIGVPMAQKLLPFVPPAVWEAIVAFIQHLAHLDDPEPKVRLFVDKIHNECIGSYCPSAPVRE